jgi:hypothetical protein
MSLDRFLYSSPGIFSVTVRATARFAGIVLLLSECTGV